MSETSIRRTPQQSRSQLRVDLILDTAADLFARLGYENTSTNAVAERAGISIGSLYRYFPDKDAILRALARRYHEQLNSLYDQVFTADLVYLPLSVLLDRLIDPFLNLYRCCPVYTHILLGSDVSTDIAAATAKMEQDTIERIALILRRIAPGLSEARAHLTATICKAEVKTLISLVATQDRQRQAELTAEIKRMLLAYLEPIVSQNRASP